MEVTCPICDDKVILIPDGVLRYCKCGSMGVDHTKEYTRYLGSKCKEDPEFTDWFKKHESTIKLLKQKITND